MAAASAAAVSRLSCSHQIHHHLIARDVKEKKGQPEHQQSCNQPTNQHFPSGAYLAVLPHAQSSLFLSNKIPNRGEREKSRLIKSNRPGNSAADDCDGCGTQQIRQSMIRRVSARIWRRKKNGKVLPISQCNFSLYQQGAQRRGLKRGRRRCCCCCSLHHTHTLARSVMPINYHP